MVIAAILNPIPSLALQGYLGCAPRAGHAPSRCASLESVVLGRKHLGRTRYEVSLAASCGKYERSSPSLPRSGSAGQTRVERLLPGALTKQPTQSGTIAKHSRLGMVDLVEGQRTGHVNKLPRIRMRVPQAFLRQSTGEMSLLKRLADYTEKKKARGKGILWPRLRCQWNCKRRYRAKLISVFWSSRISSHGYPLK